MATSSADSAAGAKPLLSRKTELLAGVDMAQWAEPGRDGISVVDQAALAEALRAVDAQLAAEPGVLAPPAELVFEALRYGGPDDCAVVILGQDPYPAPGDAQGLCFSKRKGALPESLKRIFDCLDRCGLRPNRRGAAGDLRPWAAQGVLLLNAALTTRVGQSNAHAAAWKPFVASLVRNLCERRRARIAAGAPLAPLIFLLWGGDARAHARVVTGLGQTALEWTHPSPLADNRLPDAAKFRQCPHFEQANAALAAAGRRPIVWDNLAPVVAFSDGACSLNGKPGARAGFAALVVGGQFGRSVVSGEVAPTDYVWADPARPESGVRPGSAAVAPSNNRGELLGLVHCFLALLRGRAVGPVEVVSDSEISVNTLLEWLPSRLAKGTQAELKNYDLVALAWRLLCLLREQAASVTLTHVRSHQDPPPASAPARERFLWAGNEAADRAAGAAIGAAPPGETVLGAGSLAALR